MSLHIFITKNLLAIALIHDLSLSLYALLTLDTNKINPLRFISLALRLGAVGSGSTKSERVPLGSISQA